MTSYDHLGFVKRLSGIQNDIFIPKYYNPEITDRLQTLSKTHDLVPVDRLINDGYISLSTGNEVGKIAYGTGYIPFIRTSDISNWETKADPKQGVSEEIYNEYCSQQDVQKNDILFVKDGTYLIGQSCVICKQDLPSLYQSHILKIRVSPGCPISQPLIFAALNTPIVRRQIRSKQFTADIIDTIGNRFADLYCRFLRISLYAMTLRVKFRSSFEGELYCVRSFDVCLFGQRGSLVTREITSQILIV